MSQLGARLGPGHLRGPLTFPHLVPVSLPLLWLPGLGGHLQPHLLPTSALDSSVPLLQAEGVGSRSPAAPSLRKGSSSPAQPSPLPALPEDVVLRDVETPALSALFELLEFCWFVSLPFHQGHGFASNLKRFTP